MVMLQDGSMRCDVNVSVRPRGQKEFGTKVEIKNMNTFGGMQKAIDYEIDRQVGAGPLVPDSSGPCHRFLLQAAALDGAITQAACPVKLHGRIHR